MHHIRPAGPLPMTCCSLSERLGGRPGPQATGRQLPRMIALCWPQPVTSLHPRARRAWQATLQETTAVEERRGRARPGVTSTWLMQRQSEPHIWTPTAAAGAWGREAGQGSDPGQGQGQERHGQGLHTPHREVTAPQRPSAQLRLPRLSTTWKTKRQRTSSCHPVSTTTEIKYQTQRAQPRGCPAVQAAGCAPAPMRGEKFPEAERARRWSPSAFACTVAPALGSGHRPVSACPLPSSLAGSTLRGEQ